MPLVILEHDRYEHVPGYTYTGLAKALPAIVAKALHVEENSNAHLDEKDVRVKVRRMESSDFSLAGEADINSQQLEIMIFANHFPERDQNLVERRELIEEAIKKLLAAGSPGFEQVFTVSVWVLLTPASYGQFEIKRK